MGNNLFCGIKWNNTCETIIEDKPWYLEEVIQISKDKTKLVMKIRIKDKKGLWILKKYSSFRSVKSEMLVLSRFIRSTNDILVTHEWCIYKDNFYFLYECADMDLFTYLNRYPKNKKKNIMFQVLKAIRVLHSQKIIHYDIKFENFVVDRKNTRVRLIDFEYCQHWDSPKMNFGTEIYIAPEIHLPDVIPDYSPGKQDIWSVGMMFYLWENTDRQMILNSKQMYETFTEQVKDHYILKYCLCMNPMDRLDIKELIRQYF
jgi:serine/threonine protein kinase